MRNAFQDNTYSQAITDFISRNVLFVMLFEEWKIGRIKMRDKIIVSGICIYGISFFLPAFMVQGKNAISGVGCFYQTFIIFFDVNSFSTLIKALFWNSSNLIILPLVFFSSRMNKKILILLLLVSISSIVSWIPYFVSMNYPISSFRIGYYLWSFSLLLLSLKLVVNMKKKNRSTVIKR